MINVTIKTRTPMMDYQYVLQCKVNCNSAETISIERWKQLEIKTKNWKFWEVWKFIWKNWLGERKKLKGCTCIKVFTSHYNLSRHFSNLGRERRKKMLKILQRSLSNKTYRKKNVKHHHLNVGDVQLVDLYIKIIKCAWCMKGSDKRSYSKNWNIAANINSYGMERI